MVQSHKTCQETYQSPYEDHFYHIQQDEWKNAKNHSIRIGKYGTLARMTNPQPRSGPVAGSFYPTKPGEPIRRATNDHERKEASILTHEAWMNNPPGEKNCHFLDIVEDAVGPNGITITPEKIFDNEAKWKYLGGDLNEKVTDEIAKRISLAHQRLPEIFRQISTDTKITYPFKYDCITGEYLYPTLEANLRKNI